MHNYFGILSIITGLLCLGLGLFTFSRKPRHPANIGFALGMISLTFIEAGSAIMFLAGARKQLLLGMNLVLIGEVLLPASWMLFSLAFARANYKEVLYRWAPVLAGASIIAAFFIFNVGNPDFASLLLSDIKGIDWNNIKDTALFVIGPTGQYFYIYLILGLVLNLTILEIILRSSRGTTRWQVKYIIFGVGSILAFFIYLSSKALLFSTLNIQILPATSAVTLISTSMMAFFIVRYRLLDVDIFVSRYVVYNSLAFLIVGLYLLSVGLMAQGIRYFKIPFNYFFTTLFIFLSILVLIILLFTASLRRRVQLLINRNFYKHKYEFRDKWMEAIEKISSRRSIEAIRSTLTEMISETMGARDIYLWLYDPLTQAYITTQEIADCKRVDPKHPLLQQIRENAGPFLINRYKPDGQEANGLCGEINRLVTITGAVLCAPLAVGHEIIGFILQGEDMSGEPYREDDFELLKAITTQAAVQIKNIRLTQELMTAKEIDTFNKMSSFVMHDLKNLTNSLSLVNQNAKYNMDKPEFQKDAMQTIENTVSRMKGLIDKLASIPKELELRKVEVDLKGLIENALKKVSMADGKRVAVISEINDDIPSVNVDPDAMEMVYINLLTNAYEAVEKEGEVRILARLNGDNVSITISDNGVGMPKEFIENALFKPFKTTKGKGFGIGLFQCKAIVEAHGGKIEVESREGKGTVFIVKLPIDRV